MNRIFPLWFFIPSFQVFFIISCINHKTNKHKSICFIKISETPPHLSSTKWFKLWGIITENKLRIKIKIRNTRVASRKALVLFTSHQPDSNFARTTLMRFGISSSDILVRTIYFLPQILLQFHLYLPIRLFPML